MENKGLKKNIAVLGLSTTIYFLLYFGGLLNVFGESDFIISAVVFWLVIPFLFGYLTHKNLSTRSPWLVALVPVIANGIWIVYDGIRSGWAFEKIPLLVLYFIMSVLLMLLGAFVQSRKGHKGNGMD